MLSMKIYLAGKVPKGKEVESFNNWREKYSQEILKSFDAEFIDPGSRTIDESDFKLVFGLDCKHIKNSDLIVFCAEQKLGAGTSQEMVIAKYFNKPVVVVLPKNTRHRRSNLEFNGKIIEDWIHPFIFSFADFIIEDISDFSKIKDDIFKSKIKGIEVIDSAIKYVDEI